MRPEEGTYLAHRQGNPLLGLLPREHAYFGLRREHRGLHGDSVRMRRNIVRQDQYRRLAPAHEVATKTEEAAKKAGEKIEKAAKDVREGWKEGEREDQAKGRK